MRKGGYCCWKFLVHRDFGFAIATLQVLQNPENVKISIFPFTLSRAEMLYLQTYLTNFQKLFLAERWRRWLLWLKISCARIFWFCNSNVTTFPKSRKCKNFNFPLYTVPSRNAISSNVFNEFSKTFFWQKDVEGGYCGWKSLVHRDFGFAVATLQLSKHPENVKIWIFSFTLSQQKCCIFKTVLNEFSKTFFGWKKRKVAIVVENFLCTDILGLE